MFGIKHRSAILNAHSRHIVGAALTYAAGSPTSKSGGITVTSPYDPKQNHLLDALSKTEYAVLAPNLEFVDMPLGQVLCEPGERMSHGYFPTTAIVSLLNSLEDGATSEVAVIGNDGVLGVSLFLGGQHSPSGAVVQSAGAGYRLNASWLKHEFNRAGELKRLLLRYTQALMTQTAQTAACNRRHSVEQQLCRRLLMGFDRLAGNQLDMTQELIANMLGVRREGVTEAAGKLQAAGIIRYGRGHITLLDRAALEERSCECDAVVETELKRLLPDLHPGREHKARHSLTA
jgi:CRP-like cAMP-binding protein